MAHGVDGHHGIKANVRHMIVHQVTLKMTPHHVLRDIMVTKHARAHVKRMAHGAVGHNGIKANVHLMIVHQVILKMTLRHVLLDIMVIKHVPAHAKRMAHGVVGHNGIKASVRQFRLRNVHQVKPKRTHKRVVRVITVTKPVHAHAALIAHGVTGLVGTAANVYNVNVQLVSMRKPFLNVLRDTQVLLHKERAVVPMVCGKW